MKAPFGINPLVLLIMTQAWCNVKHGGADDSLDKKILNPSFSYNVKNIISPESWDYIWDHPFFKSSDLLVPPLSIRQLSRSFGLDNKFPIISSKEQADDLLLKSKNDLFTPRAIKILWDKNWATEIPSWVLELIGLQNKKCQVWMGVSSNENISQDICNQALQLGWSWWFDAPTNASEFDAYFKSHQSLIKFWFTHPQSDQWVWPWCDILTKTITEKTFGFKQDRYWIVDGRQKKSWSHLDSLVYDEFEKSMGGHDLCQCFIYSIVNELNKVNFMNRDF